MRISDWSSDVCSSDLENATKAPPEHQLLWFVGLIVTALLVGFFLAIGLFIATFLKVRTELPNRTIAIMTACGLGVLAFVGYVLRLDYPAGLLQYVVRSEEHTSELQSLMRISYAVFCLKKKKKTHQHQ